MRSNGMGFSTPDWQELIAFAHATSVELDAWEFQTLKKMCGAYLSGFNSGKERLGIPPMERGSENSLLVPRSLKARPCVLKAKQVYSHGFCAFGEAMESNICDGRTLHPLYDRIV